MTAPRLFRISNLGVALVGMLVLAGAIAAAFDPSSAETPGLLLLVAGHATAGTLFVRRSRQNEAAETAAWTALGIALFCGAGGVLLLGLLSIAGVRTGAFGPVDLVFLSGYAAMVVGLALLTRRGFRGRGWVVTLVDTAVGAVALGTFVWVGIGNSLVMAMRDADLISRLIAPIYPLVDTAVLVGILVMFIRRTAFRLDPKLLVLSIGLATQIVADFLFLVEGVGASFQDASPRLDLFLLASACYLAVGILFDRTDQREREYPERAMSVIAMVWPYALGAGVVGMHVVGLFRLGIPADDLVTLIGALGVGILVLVRQAIAIRSAQRRVEQQRRELVASVSHEIRTPLTGIVGYLELLADAGDYLSAEERDEMLKIASDEAAALGRIITDMVAMARNDGRDLAVTAGPTRLADVCHASVERAGVDRVLIDVDDVEVFADRNRLVQAVTNLVVNAGKYGQGSVCLVARQTAGDVVFEVHDDGDGVPVRHQERIWDQFERGAHRFNALTPGMGVGLAIVRAIALAHGGEASYRRSELLGGSCFSITIPVRERPAEETRSEAFARVTPTVA